MKIADLSEHHVRGSINADKYRLETMIAVANMNSADLFYLATVVSLNWRDDPTTRQTR